MRVGAFLTTGTFNLVVKDRSTFRLSGARSGRESVAGSPSSFLYALARPEHKGKPFHLIAPVRALSTRGAGAKPRGFRQHFPDALNALSGAENVRGTTRFHRLCRFGTQAQRKMKSQKRSSGGSCDYRLNPSRNLVPEYKPRGRDQFQALPIRCPPVEKDSKDRHSRSLVVGESFITSGGKERKGGERSAADG